MPASRHRNGGAGFEGFFGQCEYLHEETRLKLTLVPERFECAGAPDAADLTNVAPGYSSREGNPYRFTAEQTGGDFVVG